MAKKFSEEEFQEFVVEQFSRLTTGLSDVRGEVRELRAEVGEMKGILEPLANAFDADAEKVVEHDRRIGRLEEHVGILKNA